MASATARTPWKSRTAKIKGSQGDEQRLHFLDCTIEEKDAKEIILLVHGFPETSHQFRHVIEPLANAGYRVIAPDYTGAGYSSKPESPEAYTKFNIAQDLHTLLHSYLEIDAKKTRVHVVGHDIGGMIAYAYAARYPDDVASVAWGECPLPGSGYYEREKTSVLLFHFLFHRIPDLPEALTAGRERIYLEHFYDRLAYNRSAITKEDVDIYVYAYSRAGAMKAGINVYRAFEIDAKDNVDLIKARGKCKVRSLALCGAQSHGLVEPAPEMAEELFGGDIQVATVPEAGHWIAEENPDGFVKEVLKFIGSS